mgnify:CR=1 FL=1
MSSDLLLVALAGFFASMVDGALGMGFGPTSSSILLAAGISPGAVSASVNLAKMATGIAAALSHWRLGNIDKRLVLRLAVPGAVGALVGVTVLANVDAKVLRPILAVLLLVVVGVTLGSVRMMRQESSPNAMPTNARNIQKPANPLASESCCASLRAACPRSTRRRSPGSSASSASTYDFC